MSSIILTDAPPQTQQNAQMHTKIVFWYNPVTQHILQGAPERFAAKRGYQKIICNHAHEAEMWSARLNVQDKQKAELNDYEQMQREAPALKEMRRELVQGIYNARNGINRLMLEKALEQLNHYEANQRSKVESYLHAEGYEHGH